MSADKALVPVTAEASEAEDKTRPAQKRAPVLIEIAYAVSLYTVIGATVGTVVISLWSGANLLMTVVRGGAVTLVLGLVTWWFNYRLMHGAFEAVLAQIKTAEGRTWKKAGGTASLGLEWKA
jgi:hypothetical protein